MEFEDVKRYVEELLRQNQYHPENHMDSALLAYKNHVRRVAKALEDSGLEFVVFQQIFKAMNPGPIGTGKILNPLTPFGPPPGAEGYLTDNADIPAAAMNPLPDYDVRRDQHLANSRRLWAQQKELNLYDEDNIATERFYIDNDDPASSGLNGTMQVESGVPGIQHTVPDYSRVFEERNAGPDFGNGEAGKKFWQPQKGMRANKDQLNKRRERALDNADSFFTQGELETGYVTPDELTADGIDDATNYMPFFLEDMRAGGKRIYFRAFFKGIRESISPNWSQESYFGRVDPVGIYLNTTRTVSLSFAVVAMSPAGFTAMWRKLNALAKMLYPTYKDGVMVKSPVCRLRVGDVVCDQSGAGLPGYISSPVELDYTDSPWEITEWTGYNGQREMGKAPMMATVSFTFQVIHERNPSVDEDYNFDTTFFRRIGGLQEFQGQEGAEGDSSTGEGVATGGFDMDFTDSENDT